MRRTAIGMWLCLLAPGLWAAERTTASFVPADSFLVIYYDGGHPGLKETTLARFVQEPEVRAAADQLRPVAEAIDQKAKAKEGIQIISILRDISGCEIILAFAKPEDPAGRPSLLAVVRTGEGDTTARRAVDRANQADLALAKPGSVRESAIGDVKVTSSIDKDGHPSHVAYVGAFVVASDSLALLKRALDPAGAKLAVPGGEDRAVLGARYDHAAMRVALGAQIDPKVAKLLDAPGAGAIKSASLNVIPRGPRLVTRLDVEIAEGEKLAGLAKWLTDCPPFDPELLKRVPKAPIVCWLTSTDFSGLWDAVWAVAESFDAAGAEQGRKSLAEVEAKSGLKFREGLLGPLGRGTVLVAKQDGPSVYQVVLQRVRDAKAFEQGLTQLGARLDVAFGDRVGPIRCGLKSFTYRNHPCQYLWLMGNAALELPGIVPCYTNLGDVFAFAANPLDLKGYLDFVEDKAPTLLDDPEFQALRAAVPAGATSLVYGNWTEQAVATYNTAAPWLTAIQGVPDMPKAIDLANLPSSRLIRRYSGASIAYSTFEKGRYRVEAQGDGLELLSPPMATAGVAALLAGVALPALAEARGAARRTQDLNSLRQIGMGVHMYRAQFGNNDFYPESLEDLFRKGLVGDWGLLVSPLDGDPAKLPNGMPCSYESCFDKYPKHRFQGDVPPTTAMVWDRKAFQPGKRNVLFFDAHVETLEEERFGRLLGDLDQIVKQPPKRRPGEF